VPIWLTPLTATLAHAGIAHLLMNMLMLLFCGRSVENILGTRGLLILYLVGAYAAAAAHLLVNLDEIAPMVGASGSISAVLGAYAIMFGRNRVKVVDPRMALALHALWLAAAWIVLQLLVGLTFETAGARIAVAAHIGGYLGGLVLAKPLLILRYRNA
jgi:membrane associated rhomboid family serine protease